MAEVETPPIIGTDSELRQTVTFTEDHSLADIARWLLTNRSEAKEIFAMLADEIGAEVDAEGETEGRLLFLN